MRNLNSRLPAAGRGIETSHGRGRNEVRIIAGAWRRQRLRFPAREDLRPTPDRVRETLFNWLGQTLHGQAALDLFAGSGALGFEAASRGAASVVLVENDNASLAALADNARRLGAVQVQIVQGDAIEFLRRTDARFDLVFLDPPFRRGLDEDLLHLVDRVLVVRGWLYVESGSAFSHPDWRIVRQSRAGKVHFHLLQRAKEDQP